MSALVDVESHVLARITAAPTVVSDRVFASFWDGYVRIYAAGDGRLFREIDTAIEYPAVNGVATGDRSAGIR